MRIYPECYNCFITQAVRSSKIHTLDNRQILNVVQNVVKALVDIDHELPPPLISEHVYGAIKHTLGIDDPYAQIKKKYNDIALNYVGFVKERIKNSDTPLVCALKFSLAGNIIDFGSEIKTFNIEETLHEVMKNGFDSEDISLFKERLKNAKRLILIADNAGEAVFDTILLETIKEIYPSIKIYVFVRAGAIINDVTLEDALYIGMGRVAKVIETKKPIPGFWPYYCWGECKSIWDSADIVISKGQGNFETLTEIADDRIFFLFIVKCKVVAEYINIKKFSKIFIRNSFGK